MVANDYTDTTKKEKRLSFEDRYPLAKIPIAILTL